MKGGKKQRRKKILEKFREDLFSRIDSYQIFREDLFCEFEQNSRKSWTFAHAKVSPINMAIMLARKMYEKNIKTLHGEQQQNFRKKISLKRSGDTKRRYIV